MSRRFRLTSCAVLSFHACVPLLVAQVNTIAPLGIRKSSPSTCARASVSVLNFGLLSKPSASLSGLNVDLGCLRTRRWKLVIDPQLIEQNPVRRGSPMFCGIMYDGDVPMKICTRG
jgi:hypothetical protein